MSFKNVLCFGSLNPDLVYFIEKLPSPGGDIQNKKYFRQNLVYLKKYYLIFVFAAKCSKISLISRKIL